MGGEKQKKDYSKVIYRFQQKNHTMVVYPWENHLSSWWHEDRRQGQTSIEIRGSHIGGCSPLDFHGRWNRLCHGFPVHHRKTRVWIESFHWKYVWKWQKKTIVSFKKKYKKSPISHENWENMSLAKAHKRMLQSMNYFENENFIFSFIYSFHVIRAYQLHPARLRLEGWSRLSSQYHQGDYWESDVQRRLASGMSPISSAPFYK